MKYTVKVSGESRTAIKALEDVNKRFQEAMGDKTMTIGFCVPLYTGTIDIKDHEMTEEEENKVRKMLIEATRDLAMSKDLINITTEIIKHE